MNISVQRARFMMVAAAVLWSLSSVFMLVLNQETALQLQLPRLTPLQIAFFRAFFAGAVLLPFIQRSQFRFRPRIGLMMLCFGVMSGLYLSAMGLGTAANAILLQNTAPFWVYLMSRLFLRVPDEPRSRWAAYLGLLGAGVIVGGNTDWSSFQQSPEQLIVFGMAIGSGIAYAAVILFLHSLRTEDQATLCVCNLLGSGCVIGLYILLQMGYSDFITWMTTPTYQQLIWILIFGLMQMALPYWLFSRGLKAISPQEAGTITLLEPILNPIWAYLIAGEKEAPTIYTFIGGAILLLALLQQYRPWSRS